MLDVMTEEQRRKNMRAIKSVSKLESIVTKVLWKEGFRFRRNSKKLEGKPDISIKKYKVVIFIDSCFFHRCPLHGNIPKTNHEFWKKKLERNQERDKEVNQYYERLNWNILRIWEHDVKNDIEDVVRAISTFIKESKVN
ncbi:DNA mismatch endonuclease Vsr [Halobacillus litoralis]|uniref:Very short patch repair endonuclease n=1 Tax=Halobacillus litoralis TaxID=45668 RepID=A0A845FD83_9BACI|nr:very short patch repair endonuclease [Halobacillus litoralis]MYL71734.1 DNA mismatch endonuclease Vsr [Halobacillus litoralis]